MGDRLRRRRRLVFVSEDFLAEVFKAAMDPGYGRLQFDLPEDATLVGVSRSLEYGGLLLCFESEAFEEVEEGALIPSLAPAVFHLHERTEDPCVGGSDGL